MGIKLNEQSLSMLDGPWLRRQVEGHLIFGPFSRHFGFGWIIVAAFTLNVITSLRASLNATEIVQILEKVFFLAVSLIFLKVSVCRQAAINRLVLDHVYAGSHMFYHAACRRNGWILSTQTRCHSCSLDISHMVSEP